MKRFSAGAAAVLCLAGLPAHGGNVIGFFQSRPSSASDGGERYVRLHVMDAGSDEKNQKLGASVEVGLPGRCSARVAGFGQFSGGTLVITPYQREMYDKECRITASFNAEATEVRLQAGQACVLFQEPACRWGGDVAFPVERP